MPHLIVEYSANLADCLTMETLLSDLHATIADSGPFKLEEIKGRAYVAGDFLVGDGGITAFVHVTVRIMPGRSLEIRQALSAALVDAVERRLSGGGAVRPFSVTVEVRELERESYQKREVTD